MARTRDSACAVGVPPISVVEIDGLPYITVDWLEKRLYRDDARAKRWRQDARRVAKRTDPDGVSLHASYMWHSLAMSHRVEKWRRCLALTQAAIVQRQQNTRVEFGLLVQDRRIAAGMERSDLASRAGVDRKTILNVERATFPPSLRVLQSVVAVPELYLTLADVNPVLLEKNPADGRKHRTAQKKTKKAKRKKKEARSMTSHSGTFAPSGKQRDSAVQ